MHTILRLFKEMHIYPFYSTTLFLYPLKISENLWFSDVLGGTEKAQ